ncbi:MAG TPA: Uma2 family endonuclease [Methylocystis sp.]|nr:Uma2 family endonuclease [Methylocystis sp.]
MSAQPQKPPRMNVDEFVLWAEDRPGRWELFDGEAVAQASERAAHWKVKFATQAALLAAVKTKDLRCHVVPDGATVRIDATSAYEPDALVYRGEEVAPSALIVENPLIIVEVLSPWTERVDRGRKLADYFRLPSVTHYLVIDPDQPLVLHHLRSGADILTRVLREGAIVFDPPGFEVALSQFNQP